MIDIFPADAGLPVRIEIVDKAIASIRSYDAVNQRSLCELDQLEVGRAAEPDVEVAACLLDHLPTGCLFLSDRADRRRQRFIAFARDAAGRHGRTLDAIDEAEVYSQVLNRVAVKPQLPIAV